MWRNSGDRHGRGRAELNAASFSIFVFKNPFVKCTTEFGPVILGLQGREGLLPLDDQCFTRISVKYSHLFLTS